MPYPTVPGRRMAYDADGSIALRVPNNGAAVEISSADKANWNDENPAGVLYGHALFPAFFAWIFPELRELDGTFFNFDYATGWSVGALQWSNDTTQIHDGTWTNIDGTIQFTTDTSLPVYRTSIVSRAISNVRAIRFQVDDDNWDAITMFRAHLYGEIAAGQTPDRLLFIDSSTGLEFGLPIDYGDTPRGSEVDQTFKLKNNSASFTASNIQITGESLYLNSGAWYTFSEGGAFQSTLPLAASIGPGASSPTITVRRNIPDAETLGLHAGRIRVSPPTWT